MLLIGKSDRCGFVTALGERAAQRATALEQVLNRGVVRSGVVIRRAIRVGLELGIGDGNSKVVAERLENVERKLLHLMDRVATFEGLSEPVALDRLRENHGWLALVCRGGGVGRVELAIVVATAFQIPNLVVGPILDHVRGAWVATEEVLAHVTARLRLVGLEVAVGGAVHEVTERSVGVVVDERVPLTTPDDLDDVPARAAEERLEFLDDLAVTAHRTVETLKVAVDDEREVVETVVRGELQRAARFDLIHFTVAEERPYVLVGSILHATVREVFVELCLIYRVDWSETHRHGRELPEVGHEARVRV